MRFPGATGDPRFVGNGRITSPKRRRRPGPEREGASPRLPRLSLFDQGDALPRSPEERWPRSDAALQCPDVGIFVLAASGLAGVLLGDT